MRLYYLAGDRTAALRQYARCRDALDQELEVKPGKRTMELYDRIRADDLETVAMPGRSQNAIAERLSTSSSEVIEHLNKLREVLNEVQRQVQQDIQALDAKLSARR
jgi:DNA-binding SARP family transcriptional activator